MNRFARTTLGAVAVLITLLVFPVGCGGRQPPPAQRAELRAARPHPEAVWVRGHWVWKGKRRGYVWVPGHWNLP